MKIKFNSVYIILLFSSGCVFSGSDIEEMQVIDGYYISSLGDTYELVYKQPDANTERLIISTNIDSIGWNGKAIFGITNNEYFIINRESQEIIDRYKNYPDFIKANQDLGDSTVVLKKTSEMHVEQ